MTWVLPKALKMSMVPAGESLTSTKLGTVCPPTKLRSDALGIVVPSGHMTRSLVVVGAVTVTFRTTAVGGMPDDITGTLPLPATISGIVAAGPRDEPPRVSRIRLGTSGLNDAPASEASVKYPLTSMTTSAEPSPL